jgi:hypothetical protein
MVPVVVICYNNYKYVMNTVAQLEKYISKTNIMILDNKSTCEDTICYLKTLPYTVFWRDENRGRGSRLM